MSVRVGREILQPDRGLAAMVNLGIHETDLSWLIVEIESCEVIVAEVLEVAIGKQRRLLGNQPGFPSLDQERRIRDRKTLCQVSVVGQHSSTVTDGEDRRDQLQPVPRAGAFHLGETIEVVGRFLAQGVEAKRDNRSVQAVIAGRHEHPGDLRDGALRFQVPAEDPDESVAEGFVRSGLAEAEGQTDEQQLSHGCPHVLVCRGWSSDRSGDPGSPLRLDHGRWTVREGNPKATSEPLEFPAKFPLDSRMVGLTEDAVELARVSLEVE